MRCHRLTGPIFRPYTSYRQNWCPRKRHQYLSSIVFSLNSKPLLLYQSIAYRLINYIKMTIERPSTLLNQQIERVEYNTITASRVRGYPRRISGENAYGTEWVRKSQSRLWAQGEESAGKSNQNWVRMSQSSFQDSHINTMQSKTPRCPPWSCIVSFIVGFFFSKKEAE